MEEECEDTDRVWKACPFSIVCIYLSLSNVIHFLSSFKFSCYTLQSSCTSNVIQQWNQLADRMIQLDSLLNMTTGNEILVLIGGEENV